MANDIPSLESLDLDLTLNRTAGQPPVSQEQAAQVTEQILPHTESIANAAIQRRQAASSNLESLNSINEQLQQELSQVEIAQVNQAEIKKANTLAAQDADDFDVNQYNQATNSEIAQRNQQTALARVQTKQAELNRLRDESETGGFFTRFVNTFKEASTKNELLEAQQELNNIRVGQTTAGHVLNSELAANAVSAGKLTTAEAAHAQEMLDVSRAHVERLSGEGKLAQSEIDSLAAMARFDKDTMSTLNGVLEQLRAANSLSAASANAAYQAAQLESFTKQEKRREDDAADKDAYWGERQKDFDAFLRVMGHDAKVGKMDFRTLSSEARKSGVMTDPLLQRFVSWDTLYNTMGKGAYSNALLLQQNGAAMSMAQKNDLSLGQRLAAESNAQLLVEQEARIKGLSPKATPADAESIKNEIKSRAIDLNTAEGISKINSLLDDHKQAALDDITPALKTGNIVTLPLQTIMSTPENAVVMNKYATRAGQELMLTDGWKDTKFEINPADPVGSVNATFDQLVAQIEKATNDTAQQDALTKTLGGVAEGYYRTTVKFSANAMGYPLQNSWQMQGIDTGEGGLGGFGGLTLQPSLQKIDLFNGAKISSILKARLRARRLAATKTVNRVNLSRNQ